MSEFSQVTVNKQFEPIAKRISDNHFLRRMERSKLWNTSFFKSFDKIPNETVVAMESI